MCEIICVNKNKAMYLAGEYNNWGADVLTLISAYTWQIKNVDLQGKARPVLAESEKDLGWAIPSPDGRHLAIWEASGSSNAWLIEGF